MNYLLLIAGVFALFACIGHFVIGAKEYLQPVLNADIEIISKKVMQSIFHYMTVFMIVTTVVLILFSININLFFKSTEDIIKITGLIYAGLAVAQILVALNSGIKGGILKLFQWVFWLLIALFSFLSVQW